MEQNLSNGGADKPVPLDYASPTTTRRGIGALGILGIVAVSLFIGSLFLPSTGRSREPANRIKCAANLKSIAQAMMLYANGHGGVFPDSFQTMILNKITMPFELICPSSIDEIAPGATPQEVAKNLTAKPGHLSYIYLGRGLTSRVSADTVLAYELPANHMNDGMNVLFGDGHVDFIIQQQAQKLIAELQAGHNPPRPEMLK